MFDEQLLVFGIQAAVDLKQAADIAPAVLDRCDAEVAAWAGVHFEVSPGVKPLEVAFQAQPFALGGNAARGADLAGLTGLDAET